MSEEKKQIQNTLFNQMLQLIGRVAQEEHLTLPVITGQLRLLEHHLITQVAAQAAARQAAEQSEGDDKQEQTDASPDEVVGTA